MVLKTGERSLQHILDDNKFVIPDYQRYYSWDLYQLNELWEDLITLTEKQGVHTHFMGTIVCKQNSDSYFEIVDGQQRLSTLLILINCLEEYGEYSNTLELQKGDIDDNSIFQKLLNNEEVSPKAPSQRKLQRAKNFFEEKMSSISKSRQAELIEDVYSLEFMAYKVDSNEKATLIFQSVNDRGKKLTKLEKTKSFLVHRLYLNTQEGERRNSHVSQLRENFAKIYVALEKIERCEKDGMSEDEIQAIHLSSYLPKSFTDDRRQVRKNSFAQMKKFIKSEESAGEVLNYTDKLAEFFDAYQDILFKKEGKEWKKMLSGEATYFMPVVLASRNKEKFDKISRVIEAAVFRTHYKRRREHVNQGTYFQIARELKQDKIGIEKAIVKIKKTARLQ